MLLAKVMLPYSQRGLLQQYKWELEWILRSPYHGPQNKHCLEVIQVENFKGKKKKMCVLAQP